MESEVPKFCKDCKWARPSWLGRLFGDYTYAKCAATDALRRVEGAQYLVTGYKPKGELYYCSTQRDSERAGMCRSEARFWESKYVPTNEDKGDSQ